MTPTDDGPPLADGAYDVLVVDVTEPDEPGGSASGPTAPIRVEVVVTAGVAKGETVWIGFEPSAADRDTDPIGMLGLPGRLTVEQGAPRLTLDAWPGWSIGDEDDRGRRRRLPGAVDGGDQSPGQPKPARRRQPNQQREPNQQLRAKQRREPNRQRKPGRRR